MPATLDDARKLLADAGIPLQSPHEGQMGISRVALCRWLLETAQQTKPDIAWNTPLESLDPEMFEESGESPLHIAVFEAFSLSAGEVADQDTPATFGDFLKYVETRLSDLWRDPEEGGPEAVQRSFFAAFRETLDSRIPLAAREVKPEENLREAVPATEADRDETLKLTVRRRFGVELPIERQLWGCNWEYWWFVFWALSLWFGWKVLLPLTKILFILWIPASAVWLSWMLYEMSQPTWNRSLTTLGDLSRYLLQEHRKVRTRVNQALEKIAGETNP
ncbi:MAG: hypothetical protein OHK0029_36480 [Armatimonadaceae bacterium]